MSSPEEFRLGVYRHFKGRLYRVFDLAKHTETGEMMVVYRDLDDSKKVFVRPLTHWNTPVDAHGAVAGEAAITVPTYPRFTWVRP